MSLDKNNRTKVSSEFATCLFKAYRTWTGFLIKIDSSIYLVLMFNERTQEKFLIPAQVLDINNVCSVYWHIVFGPFVSTDTSRMGISEQSSWCCAIKRLVLCNDFAVKCKVRDYVNMIEERPVVGCSCDFLFRQSLQNNSGCPTWQLLVLQTAVSGLHQPFLFYYPHKQPFSWAEIFLFFFDFVKPRWGADSLWCFDIRFVLGRFRCGLCFGRSELLKATKIRTISLWTLSLNDWLPVSWCCLSWFLFLVWTEFSFLSAN